jgi:hypothetical protein
MVYAIYGNPALRLGWVGTKYQCNGIIVTSEVARVRIQESKLTYE